MSTPLSQPRTRVPRFAEAAVERARLTVVPRRATRAPRVPFISLVSFLLVTGVGGLLLFNTHMQQASFVATSMEEQATVLAAKEESLRMELDRLRDPQNVAKRAKQLGMVPAANPAFIRLSDGSVLGSPTAAAPTDAMEIAPLPPQKPKSLRPDPVVLEQPLATADDTGEVSSAASPDRDGDSRTKKPNAERQTQGRTR
jgi:hypothetical protein